MLRPLTLWRSILSITDKSVMLEIPPWVTSILLFTTVASGSHPNMSAKSFMTFAECSCHKQHHQEIRLNKRNELLERTCSFKNNKIYLFLLVSSLICLRYFTYYYIYAIILFCMVHVTTFKEEVPVPYTCPLLL